MLNAPINFLMKLSVCVVSLSSMAPGIAKMISAFPSRPQPARKEEKNLVKLHYGIHTYIFMHVCTY